MRFEQAFAGVTKIFLDTAPIIYYVERHPSYFAIAQPIFQAIQTGTFQAVTSPITLAECLEPLTELRVVVIGRLQL